MRVNSAFLMRNDAFKSAIFRYNVEDFEIEDRKTPLRSVNIELNNKSALNWDNTKIKSNLAPRDAQSDSVIVLNSRGASGPSVQLVIGLIIEAGCFVLSQLLRKTDASLILHLHRWKSNTN
jgi:hypothetical protein